MLQGSEYLSVKAQPGANHPPLTAFLGNCSGRCRPLCIEVELLLQLILPKVRHLQHTYMSHCQVLSACLHWSCIHCHLTWRMCVAQVYDNPVLGMWVHRMRRDLKKKLAPQWQVDKLDSIQFAWKVDQISAKWHHNFHEARRYKARIRPLSGSFD